MTTLGFDTSTAATSACVLRDDGEAFDVSPPPERLGEPPGHSRELLPAAALAMERAAVSWEDVDALAVGVGPGTFTGLRIGIATARAIAAARGLPIHPVSSLAALAAGIEAAGPAAFALPVIDARRGELFAALFEHGRAVLEPFAAEPVGVVAALGKRAAGAVAAGDGSIRFRKALEAAGVSVAPDNSELHVVRAAHVCRLAAGVPAAAPEAVLPTYLREPDARPSQ